MLMLSMTLKCYLLIYRWKELLEKKKRLNNITGTGMMKLKVIDLDELL